jgi:deferrochelatase/peroxidase EfeB
MNSPNLGSNAQTLVVKGYKNSIRRNYLIRIVNDDSEAATLGPDTAKIQSFLHNRSTNWVNHGILPRSVLFKLLKLWNAQHGAQADKSGTVVPSHFVDVGFTFEGFLKLQAHRQLTDLLRIKAPAFAKGAFLRASQYLGDSGKSDPLGWEPTYQPNNIHCVIIVHEKTSENAELAFKAFEDAIFLALSDGIRQAASENAQTSVVAKKSTLLSTNWIEQSTVLDNPKELHFGLVDGLSMPRFEGIDSQEKVNREASFNQHKAGELLLGYEKNDGANPWLVPGAYAQERRSLTLSKVPDRQAYGDFFRDGSFGVLRKISQDVPKFEEFLKLEAARHQGANSTPLGLEYTKAWLKSKMVGRWPNGQPANSTIETIANKDRLPYIESLTKAIPYNAEADNSFSFKDDLKGTKCPFGSHIRRMNPRDDPVVPKLRRPLLRRGASYGKKYDKSEPNNDDRGLLGLFFCASIEEQFEHVLGNWANNNPMGMPFNRAGKDPIIGNHEPTSKEAPTSLEVPMPNGEINTIEGFSAFVQTRGTCYAFFPSLSSLSLIAQGKLTAATQFLD